MILLPPNPKDGGSDHHQEVIGYYMEERDGILCLDSPRKSNWALTNTIIDPELAFLSWDT